MPFSSFLLPDTPQLVLNWFVLSLDPVPGLPGLQPSHMGGWLVPRSVTCTSQGEAGLENTRGRYVLWAEAHT